MKPMLTTLNLLTPKVFCKPWTVSCNERGVPAVSYTGNQVRILTDSAHNKARILQIDGQRIQRDIKAGRVVVVAGFQGVDEKDRKSVV